MDFDESPYVAICYDHPFIYARQKSWVDHSVLQFKLDAEKNTFSQVREVTGIRPTQDALLRYHGSRHFLIANEHPYFTSYLVFIDLSKSKYLIKRHRLSNRVLSLSDIFKCSDSYYIWVLTSVEDVDDPLCMHLWKVDNRFASIERLKIIPVHTYDLHHELAAINFLDSCDSRVADLALEFHEQNNGIDIGGDSIKLVGIKVQRYSSLKCPPWMDSFEIPKRSIERGCRSTVTECVLLDNYLVIGLTDIGIDIYDLYSSRLLHSIAFPSFRHLYKVNDKVMVTCSQTFSLISVKLTAKYT